jgi:hypothetical protein
MVEVAAPVWARPAELGDYPQMSDHHVIEIFVAHLRGHGHPQLRVEHWPDQDNRRSSDIDAIAGGFAIEHTSIDTLPNQRRDSDWFMRAVGGLEEQMEQPLTARFHITLEYSAVAIGQNWASIRAALKLWITEEAPRLPDGPSIVENVPEIPFRLHILKSSARPPGLIFSRFEPKDDTLPMRLRTLIERKVEKLAPYNVRGFATILLIESDDIALMNEVKMRTAFQQAFPGGLPASLDQVWYADTSTDGAVLFRDLSADIPR